MADAHRLLELFERVAHLGERYGVARALHKDKELVDQLRDEYQLILEEVRRLVKPTAVQQMARSQYHHQQAYYQQAAQQMGRIFSDLAYVEEKDDHVIEFSL